MMLLPPMAKMLGPFGIERYGSLWNGTFLGTLLAHEAMGVALGLVVQKRGKYPGLFFGQEPPDEQNETCRLRGRVPA